MALQFTPNPRASGNLSLAANPRARMSSIVSIDWNNVTGKPTATQQIVTSGSVVNVAATDDLIIINKTVGSPTTVNLFASASKVGAVKIVDWKGDAGTNNITVNASGSEKLNGNLSSWVIAADGASLNFDPIKDGSGYAV